jgi:hypothetical protein
LVLAEKPPQSYPHHQPNNQEEMLPNVAQLSEVFQLGKCFFSWRMTILLFLQKNDKITFEEFYYRKITITGILLEKNILLCHKFT